MTRALSIEDRLDIEQTVARYAHILNNRDFDALHLVFSEDAVHRTVAVAEPRVGLSQIREALSDHPIPDHTTANVCVDIDEEGVRVWSMFLVVLDDGRTINGDYLDRMVTTDRGWRIAERTVVRRYEPEGEGARREAYASWLFSRRG